MLQFSPKKGRKTMRRRDFIAGLMFAAAMGRAQTQQTGKVYRIAFAHPTAPVADLNQASRGSLTTPAIFEELTRLGYVEGRNLLIERYSGEGRTANFPDLARQIANNLQQSWRFDWEPPKAVLRDVRTIDWIFGRLRSLAQTDPVVDRPVLGF
jgi:hypothetical protein